jgi:hypothetical protein
MRCTCVCYCCIENLREEWHRYEVYMCMLLLFVENLREEWHRYEEQYDALSTWIKETETTMKAEANQQGSLEDKTIQLEKQRVSI